MSDFTKAFTFIFDGVYDRDHLNGGWSFVSQRIVEHLEISGKAVLISILIGVPIGIFLGHIHRFSFIAINVSNLGRALPSLAVLAIFLPITGVGQTTAIIALVILAAPPILTNAYVAVDGVDTDTVDAAKGIGLRPLQILLRVELPLALPLIFAGIRTAAVFVIATATLTGYFGGGGLGDIISNSAVVPPVRRDRRCVRADRARDPVADRLRRASKRLITPAALAPSQVPSRTSSAPHAGPAPTWQSPPSRTRWSKPLSSKGALPDESVPNVRSRRRYRRRCRGAGAYGVRVRFQRGRRWQDGSTPRSDTAGNPPASSGGTSALPGTGKPAVTMGDKDFAEEFLLGQLYSQALKAKGYTREPEGEHR